MGINKIRRWISTGALCFFAGVLLTLYGAVRTVGFLKIVHTYASLTARELLVRLIIPHMVMLTGLGLLTGSVIFFTRTVIIRRRMRGDDH